jgi:hypothetical protein
MGPAAGTVGSGSPDQVSASAPTRSASEGFAYYDAAARSDTVSFFARGRGTGLVDYQGPGSCSPTAIPPCGETTMDEDAPSAWGRAVASIIEKLLALTGWSLLSWIAASCVLTVMGTLILRKARRRSEAPRFVWAS